MLIPTTRALQLLNKEAVENVSIINYLDAHPDARIQQFGQSLLVRKEGVVYISSQDSKELKEIIACLDDTDTFFASLQIWIAQTIKGDRETKLYLQIPRYVLPSDVALPEQKHPVRALGAEHADMVAISWAYDDLDEGNRGYVLACLERGPTAALVVDGEPVAWAGVHEDGALGFLYTKEEHRGKGYAQAITINMINQQRKQGRIPFVNIEEGKNSLGLAVKLGFVPAGATCWVEF